MTKPKPPKAQIIEEETVNWSNAVQITVGSKKRPRSGIIILSLPVSNRWIEITVGPPYGYSIPSQASTRAWYVYNSLVKCNTKVGIFDYLKNQVQYSWKHPKPIPLKGN